MKTQFPRTSHPELELGQAQRDYAHPELSAALLERRPISAERSRFHARIIFGTPDPDLAPQMLNQSKVASVR
jgi:hypothetical protein